MFMFYFSGLESFYKRSGKSGHKCLDSVKSHFLASILVKPSWTNVSFPPTVKHSKCVLFLYVNGWSLSWKLLHYQLYELTWSGDKRPWIPNNCLAGKGKEGWAQPLEGREHLWKRTLNFVLALIGRVRLVLESRSGPEPSWGHHKELKQGCCRSRCVCTGYPSSPSEGKKNPITCFSNLFVLCEEMALPWDALRQSDEEAWHKFPSLCEGGMGAVI